MLNRIKKTLGMVGVKVEIIAPGILSRDLAKVDGTIKITSKTDQRVQRIIVRMMEITETREMDGDYDTDHHELGKTENIDGFDLKAGEEREVPFTLYFNRRWIDNVEESGGVMGALMSMGRSMVDSDSRFYLSAVVDLEGVVLDPSDKHYIRFE